MPVRDRKRGKATPQNASDNNNLPDYDVPGNWQQPSDSNTEWSATGDVKLNEEGEANIPLTLIGDEIPEDKETIKWEISKSDPFGFKEKKYTFTEGDQDQVVNISVSDDKEYRSNKNVTINIKDDDPLNIKDDDPLTGGTSVGTLDNDPLTGGTSVGTLDNDPLTGDAGVDTSIINSPSEGIDTITDFATQEDDNPLVSESGFGGGLTEGDPLAEQFTIGSATANTSEPFIYDSSAGGAVF